MLGRDNPVPPPHPTPQFSLLEFRQFPCPAGLGLGVRAPFPGHGYQGRRQVKICGVGRTCEGGARAYSGGLEAEPTGPTPPSTAPLLLKLVQIRRVLRNTRRICTNFRSDL